MGSTFECNKCKECIRVSNATEFNRYKEQHKKKCKGKFESLWKDYNNIPKENKERLAKKVMFRYGKLGKLR